MENKIKIFQSADYQRIQTECNDFMADIENVIHIKHDVILTEGFTPFGASKEIQHIIFILYQC